MHRFTITILVALFIAASNLAQDCTWCDAPIAEGETVHWQRYPFCSEDCRHEWYLDRRRCKICNEKVEPKSGTTTRTDGMFIYMNFTPKNWDGYCDWCRDGVKEGRIDPVKDLWDKGPPIDESAAAAAAGAAAPMAETKREPEPDESGGFVLDIVLWVGGIGVALVFVMKKLLG